jgi:hypothetical protein
MNTELIIHTAIKSGKQTGDSDHVNNWINKKVRITNNGDTAVLKKSTMATYNVRINIYQRFGWQN